MPDAIPEDDAPDPDGDRAPDGRAWQEVVDALFEWANRILLEPPPPLTWKDAVYMGAVMMAQVSLVKFAKTGAIPQRTMYSAMRTCALLMAGFRTAEEQGSDEANAMLAQLGDWFTEVYPNTQPQFAARGAAVRAEMERATPAVLGGLRWEGDTVKGFADAARRFTRGEWRAIVSAYRSSGGWTSEANADEREIVAALEAIHMTLDTPLSKTKAGGLAPSFGMAIDTYLAEHAPKRRRLRDNDFLDAMEASENAEWVAETRVQREIARLRGIVESNCRLRGRSQYAALVVEHAWRLFRDNNPTELAKELNVADRPLRRAWATQKMHLLRVPELSDYWERLDRAR